MKEGPSTKTPPAGHRRRRQRQGHASRVAVSAARMVGMAVVAATAIPRTTSAFSLARHPSKTRRSAPVPPFVSFSSLQQQRQQQQQQQRLRMVANAIESEHTETIGTIGAIGDITMNDVVASAAIELEEREAQQQQQQQQQQNHHQPKTPFEWFEDFDRDRIAESEKVPLDRLRENDDQNSKERITIDASEIVSWNNLKALVARGMTTTTMTSVSNDDDGSGENCQQQQQYHGDDDRIDELYRLFEASGGYLVVELDDDDASVVADMWSAMGDYFSLPEEKQDHHLQVLKKDDGSHDPEAGYHFQQTYMNPNGEILPETIQNALHRQHRGNEQSGGLLGNNGGDEAYDAAIRRGIEGSYKLFANITRTVGIAMASGALGKDLSIMNKVVSSMLDDRSGHAFVNADHRLSRYILGSRSSSGAKESLISHTDWTLTTCIPLSVIPGLQLWRPSEKEYVVPEALLGTGNDNNNNNGRADDDRTRYVVVMAGKWLELLTNRRVSSCVHRVVTGLGENPATIVPRLSAPFFLRTKKSVFNTVSDEFHDSWWTAPATTNNNSSHRREDGAADTVAAVEYPSSLSREEAIEAMGGFFADWIRFLEGDRDPDIHDCALDLCLFGRDEAAPGCYSVEDVLVDGSY